MNKIKNLKEHFNICGNLKNKIFNINHPLLFKMQSYPMHYNVSSKLAFRIANPINRGVKEELEK